MIYIVFQQADVDVLKKSFPLNEDLCGDIIEIKDDYAVGPLQNIFTPEGIEARKDWWRTVLKGSDIENKPDSGEVDDDATLNKLKERLRDNDEAVWIWVAPNNHDISGYYWLISQLTDFQSRIFILHLHNLPFINEKGHIFYPVNIYDIPAKEFIKAKKLARPVTPAEFEIDSDEWNKLSAENKGVRILEGGKKLIQHNYDFYDNELYKYITPDWQKANKLLHTFFGKNKLITGDAYLLWRLKQMIANEKIDAQGEVKTAKDFEVKLKE